MTDNRFEEKDEKQPALSLPTEPKEEAKEAPKPKAKATDRTVSVPSVSEATPKKGKQPQSKHLPYTKTRISTIPLHSHPEKEKEKKQKKQKKKRNWKWFSFVKKEKRIKNKYDKDEMVAGSVKTVATVSIVTVIALVLAFLFLRGVMDIFALGKSDYPVRVTIEEYSGVSEIADVLYENGVIRYPTLFELWAILKNDTHRNFEAGEYIVSPAMNYDALLDVFVPSEYEHTEVTIKIPQGSSVDDVIDIFLENGIGTREGFAEVINHYEFDTEKYWFLKELPENDPHRIWRLEGFLYPDTYFFYSDSSEVFAITKLLDRFLELFKKSYMKNCEEQGMTLVQALTMASVITRDTLNDVDYKPVSQVLANRLNHPDFGYLSRDCTLQYKIRHEEGAYRDLTDADRELATPYNTYTTPGLPPSPICSPTITTIQAALYPSATELHPDANEYYYYVLMVDEYCAYAKTEEEYLALLEKDRIDRENAAQGGDIIPEDELTEGLPNEDLPPNRDDNEEA